MEIKQKFKQVIQKIARAELEEALLLLKDVITHIDVPKVDIIIRCCKLCVSNISSPDCISEVFLYDILKLTVLSIESLSEPNLLSFIQSMYHIVKFLVVKGSYETVAKMEDIMFPRILPPPTHLSEKHRDIYNAISRFMLKSLVDAKAQDGTVLLMCQITFRSCFYSNDLMQAFSIVDAYINMKMKNDTRQIVYVIFLDSMRCKFLPAGCEEPFRNILHILYSVLFSYASAYDFVGLRDFHARAAKQGNSIFRHEEYRHLHNVLRFPLFLANADKNHTISEIQSCKDSLTALDSLIKSQKVRQAVSNLLDCLMEHVLKYQKTANTWSRVDEELQLACFEFIFELSSFDSKLEQKCTCKCDSKQIFQSCSYVRYVTAFIRSYIVTGKSTTQYHESCCRILERFFGYVLQLKENDCRKLETIWGYLVVGSYNVAVKLFEGSSKAAVIYFKFVIDKYYRFGSKYSPNSLTYSLHGVCNLLAKDHEELLAFSALSTYLRPDEKETYMSIFTKTKYAMSSETDSKKDVKEITLVSVFAEFKHHLSFLSTPIEMSKEEQVNLLKIELEFYRKKWKSKVAMMTALTELVAIADLDVVVQTIVDVFGDGEVIVHEKMPGVFSELLQKYEESNIASKYNLAVLNFINYRYKNQEARTKNIAEMERALNFLVKTKSAPSGPEKENPNEECDIVSGFESLRLNNFSNQLNFLDRSLELLTEIRGKRNPGAFDVSLRLYYEYRLHQYKIAALRALELALEQAEIEKNAENVVTVISFILEEADASKKFIKDLINQADKYVSVLDQSDITDVKIVVMYYLNRSKAHLYIDYDQTVEYYNKVKCILQKWDSPDINILRCHFNMLRHKIILLPCNQKNRAEHADLSLLSMDLAISSLFEEYGEKRLQGSYGMLLLFEFSEELAKFYYSIRCPREVRAHCKEVIHLAQKLVLPLRSATLLQYLAYADLTTNRIDDAQYKLNSMAEILCLNKTKILEVPEPMAKVDLESGVALLTDSMREMVLEEPSHSQYGEREYRSLSPIFDSQPFQIPSFVHHPKSCKCIFCFCLQYQILVLEKSRLDASINIKRDNYAAAKDILTNALNFYDCCDTRYKYLQDTVGDVLNKNLLPCFEEAAFQTHGRVLLDYSYHLRRMGRKEQAIDANNKLLQLLVHKKAEHPYLLHEAAVQSLGYLTEVPEVVSPVEEEADEEFEDNAIKEFQSTPEDNRAKVVLVVTPEPSTDEQKPTKITLKKIPFHLSPSPDRRTKTPVMKKGSSVSTPAAKIPIFTDTCSTTKRSTRKRLETNPGSSSAMKPPASTTELNLKSKTKLLTEKLKQNAKKIRDQSGESTSGESTSSVESLTRKKLFSDEPMLRRSHRSRKNQ